MVPPLDTTWKLEQHLALDSQLESMMVDDPAMRYFVNDCVCPRNNPFNPAYSMFAQQNEPVVTQNLRCFPHCCPKHSNTCNGCPISIEFTLAHAKPQDVSNYLVFLRFEPVNKQGNQDLRVGDEVPCESIVDHVRTAKHPMGEWLPSQDYVFDPATRIAQCTCKPIHSQGWNYPWMHASTPATLTAYLFFRFMRDQHALLRVVGTKQSPSFVLSQDTFAIERGFYEQYPSPPHRSPTSNNVDASIMMLYSFVSQLPLHVVQKESSRINRHVQQALLRPLLTKLRVHPTMLERYLATSKLIVPNVFQDTEDLKPPSPTNDLETISINLLLELFQPKLLQKMQEIYVHQTDAILQKSSLISLYEAWKELLETHINQYLTQTTRFTNHNQFIQELRKIIPLQTPPNPFEAFVAQLRECYIAKEQPQHVDPMVYVSKSTAFNGRWLYDVPAEQPVLSNAISMVTMLRWVTMAYSFRQYLEQNTFCVRSDLAMHPTIWSTFYLDNEYRVARVFPNGETTMREWSSQWLHGDYIGTIEDGSIALTFYSWPMECPNVAYLVRLRITPLSTTQLLYQWRLSTCAVAEGGDYCTMSATMRQQSLRGKEKALMSIDMNYHRMPVA